jgi:membrane protein implicated in regulation of membrane protease activity
VDPDISTHGFIEIEGELWKVECTESLAVGDQVTVHKHRGLTLEVKKKV